MQASTHFEMLPLSTQSLPSSKHYYHEGKYVAKKKLKVPTIIENKPSVLKPQDCIYQKSYILGENFVIGRMSRNDPLEFQWTTLDLASNL